MNYLLIFLFIATAHGLHSRRYDNVVLIKKDQNGTAAAVDPEKVYCFQYTWLATLNNETFLPFEGKTCKDKYALYKPMPLCMDPMIVSDNRKEPDTEFLLNQRWKNVNCELSDGYTCAKFTYRFNGKVENVTRFCAKVTVGDGPMESGCITSETGAYQKEICACNKMLGRMPCNGSGLGANLFTSLVTIAVVFVLLFQL